MFHLNNTPTGLKQYEGDLKKKYTFLGELLLYVLYRIFTDLVCLTVFVCIYSHAVFRHDAPRKHPNLGGYERSPQEKADIAWSQLFVNKSRCATVPEDFAQVQMALCEPSLYFPNANKTTGSQMRPFIHLLSAGIKVCQHSLSLPL